MAAFLQDPRYAARALRRTVGLTAVIVASLGIGRLTWREGDLGNLLELSVGLSRNRRTGVSWRL